MIIKKSINEFKSQFSQFQQISKVIKRNLALQNLLIDDGLDINEESKTYHTKPVPMVKGRVHLGNS